MLTISLTWEPVENNPPRRECVFDTLSDSSSHVVPSFGTLSDPSFGTLSEPSSLRPSNRSAEGYKFLARRILAEELACRSTSPPLKSIAVMDFIRKNGLPKLLRSYSKRLPKLSHVAAAFLTTSVSVQAR